jgi:glycosyltransferase involved in cell wall biosynthesis
MKILQVHNYYQQAGGEDSVVASELELLRVHGHEVVTYYKYNDALGSGLWALGKASLQTLWNWNIYREFRDFLKTEKPNVVHCHNTFPLISPSIYWACAKEMVPVVQTLHNYRLLCLNAFLFRQSSGVKCDDPAVKQGNLKPNDLRAKTSPSSAICELCVGKRFKWPGVKFGCYRESKGGALVIALMLLFHKLIGTWSKKVTGYIALTEFQKQKMIEGGLPADKIFVKPNFIQTTEDSEYTEEDLLATKERREAQKDGDLNLNDIKPKTGVPYALFVGRLSPEKGCDVLIRAWALLEQQSAISGQESVDENSKPVLLIVGDGPERSSLESLASSLMPSAQCLVPENIFFLGQQPKESVLSLIRNAQFLVLPSIWYEGFPMTIVEAFSCGTAVVASNDGGMGEIIVDKQNGLRFSMGDDRLLASQMEWSFSHAEEMKIMGMAARGDFEHKYSTEVNYSLLMEIYKKALASI